MESEIIKSILLQLDCIKSVLGYVITQTQDPLKNPPVNPEDKNKIIE